MPFTSGFKPPSNHSEAALWFLFQNEKLLLKNESDTVIQSPDLAKIDPNPLQRQYFGSLDGLPCYAAELPKGVSFPEAFSLHGIRTLFGRLEDEIVFIAGVANQLVQWNRNHI